MLAAEIERHAGLPGAPTRAHCTHVVLHPLSGFRPRHPETSRHVTLNLGSQPEHETSLAHRLQVPRDVCGSYRAFGEGQRNTGDELKGRRLLRGERHHDKRVVLRLCANHRIVASSSASRTWARIVSHCGRGLPPDCISGEYATPQLSIFSTLKADM